MQPTRVRPARSRHPRHWWLIVLAATALALASGESPAGPYREYEIRVTADMPAALARNPTDSDLIHAIASLMTTRLELPLPPSVRAYVYVNEATLVDGLITLAGEKSEDAWDRGRFAAGVATRVGIFFRGDYLAQMHLLARAGLFAHELTHVSQRTLAKNRRVRGDQWLREGHADWVKFRVLDLLGFRRFSESRDEVMRAVLRSTTPLHLFPSLDTLASNTSWTASMNRLGAPATYGQAFLAVDWLVERHGDDKVREIFTRHQADGDFQAQWAKVFSISYREFVEEFRARLELMR
ncbi:MAG TPA: hypothetical protein VGL09_03205 [Methylomirabilota bacterium]|jgi:hypothetical protein